MEILCNKYQIYRRDRNDDRNGGGVLIAVSCHISSELISLNSTINIEFVSVQLNLKNKKVFVTCSYIPPASEQSVYHNHLQAIENVVQRANETDSVFVLGDFNLPSVKWQCQPDYANLVPTKTNIWADDFLNGLSDQCLFQMNGVFNKYNKLLDLVFVDDPNECFIKRTLPITNPEDCYHPTIEIDFTINNYQEWKKGKTSDEKIYCFKKANYTQLNNLIQNTNWLSLLNPVDHNSTSIDAMINIFYNKLKTIMDICIPKYTYHQKSGPPWSSSQLSKLKNKKNKLYKKYKKSASLIDLGNYSICRAEYNKLNIALYHDYLNRMKSNFKRDPKSFYKFVNSKRRSQEFPPAMKYGNSESADDSVVSNLFADFFASTYSNSKYCSTIVYPYQLTSYQSIVFPSIDCNDVLRSLKTLKNSFNHGPDGIASCILINCAESLSLPLTIMFNISIENGYFPKIWRESYIIPFFKSGSKSDISNYRGIAKLSTIPKLFEKLITNYICHHVSSIWSPYQHGFRKSCSTTTNLLQLTTSINQGFLQGEQTDVIYTDFSKAFDKVNHDLLLHKLLQLGFTSNSLKWISSYLSDRKQRVLYKNKMSKHIAVLSGVPQGSHLGPILFSLFINDLPTVIQFSNVLLYADDVKIFMSYKPPLDQSRLQTDLDSFQRWCNINLMDLNLLKCKCMRFSRKTLSLFNYFLGGHQLDIVDNFLDLGILLDVKLSFIPHIHMTVNKARGVLAFIKRWSKEFTDPYITKKLYTSLVRPILEYGSIIWDPLYNVHINYIESVQKQFLIFCLRGLPWNSDVNLPSYNSRLMLIRLPTLKSRRTMLNVSFLFNVINGKVFAEFLLNNITFNVPQRPTRNFRPLFLQFFRSNYANADPLRRISKDFNDLYECIDFSLSSNVIKSRIIIYLNS